MEDWSLKSLNDKNNNVCPQIHAFYLQTLLQSKNKDLLSQLQIESIVQVLEASGKRKDPHFEECIVTLVHLASPQQRLQIASKFKDFNEIRITCELLEI